MHFYQNVRIRKRKAMLLRWQERSGSSVQPIPTPYKKAKMIRRINWTDCHYFPVRVFFVFKMSRFLWYFWVQQNRIVSLKDKAAGGNREKHTQSFPDCRGERVSAIWTVLTRFWYLLMTAGRSKAMTTRGKPPTWFPREYLVKQERLARRNCLFEIFEISTKNDNF